MRIIRISVTLGILLIPEIAIAKGSGPGFHHYISDDESKEFLDRSLREKKRWFYDYLEIKDPLERANSFAFSNEFLNWWLSASNEDILEFIKEIEDLDMVESHWLKSYIEGYK